MLWKILLTLGLILAGYLGLKARMSVPGPGSARAAPAHSAYFSRRPLLALAYAILAVMLLGSGIYLWHRWDYGNRVLNVQVVNAATGAIVTYQARRRDIEGRVVRALDGREIRLADVERMILTEAQGDP